MSAEEKHNTPLKGTLEIRFILILTMLYTLYIYLGTVVFSFNEKM